MLLSDSRYSDFYWYENGDMISIGDVQIQYYCFPKYGENVVARTRLATEELYKMKKRRGNNMKIEHIALYVNDLEETKKFFIKYLGAKSKEGYHNPKTNFRSYFLSFDGGARLEIMNKPEMADMPKELARTGYAHIAFSVGSKEKVDILTAELKADGYEIVSGPRTTGDGYYESCIVAIEGNRIEITV